MTTGDSTGDVGKLGPHKAESTTRGNPKCHPDPSNQCNHRANFSKHGTIQVCPPPH